MIVEAARKIETTVFNNLLNATAASLVPDRTRRSGCRITESES